MAKATIAWQVEEGMDVVETNIYRATASSFTPSSSNLIATVNGSATSYVDDDLYTDINYFYIVEMVRSGGLPNIATDAFSVEVDGPPEIAQFKPFVVSYNQVNDNLIEIVASGYEGEDSHLSSDWVIKVDSKPYMVSLDDGENKESYDISDEEGAAFGEYEVIVRYNGSQFYSEWSDVFSFTLDALVNQPTILSSSIDYYKVTFQSSSFSSPGSSDSHDMSIWELYQDGNLLESEQTGSDLTSWSYKNYTEFDDPQWSFSGHTSRVVSTAADVDGNSYSGSWDSTVRKIDPDGNQVWVFEGHTSTVNDVDVDSDGFVYSASSDNTVRKINPDGNEVWSFSANLQSIFCVAVGSDGYVYSGGRDNAVRKIDPDGNQVWVFSGHTEWVNGISVDSEGYVYSGSNDNTVRKIDPDGNQVWVFSRHTDNVESVDVDSEGYVYSGGRDGTVRKIDPDGNQVWSKSHHDSIVWSVHVDDYGYIYSGGADRTARKIDTHGDEIWTFTSSSSINAISSGRDGYAYIGSADNILRKIGDPVYDWDNMMIRVRYIGASGNQSPWSNFYEID